MKDIKKILNNEFESGKKLWNRWVWAMTSHLKDKKHIKSLRIKNHKI